MSDPIDEITSHLEKSYSISASAGCGKTYAIVARVIALLKSGVSIKRLLLLTFSENAAAEMRERIIEKLKENRNEEWAIKALDEIHFASISTFHSFSLEICKEFSEDLGIDRQIMLLDDIARTRSQTHFFNKVFNSWGNSEALQTFLIISHIFGISRKVFQSFFSQIYDIFEFGNEKSPQGGTDTSFDSRLEELSEEIKFASHELIKTHENCDKDIFTDSQVKRYEKFISLAIAITNSANIITAISIIKNRSDYIGSSKFSLKNKKNQVDDAIEELGEKIDEISEKLSNAIFETSRNLLLDAVVDYRTESIGRGQLTFNDLILGAKKILQNESSSYEIWQRYDTIIVDEFQDTDPNQLEIVKILSENESQGDLGRLFVVGDFKQSIYGFRGVNVQDYVNFIESKNLESLELKVSRRTTENILKNVNSVMENLLPEYSSMDYIRKDFSSQAHYEVYGKGLEENSDSIRRAQAKDTSDKILSVHGVEIYDKHLDSYLPSNFKDINVLIRDRSVLPYLIEEFNKNEIPFSIDSPTLIFDNRFTQMFITLLSAIAMPSNAINTIGALRTPLFRCTNDDLILFKKLSEKFEIKNNIWDVNNYASEQLVNLSEAEQKVINALNDLENKRESANKTNFIDLIFDTLFESHLAFVAAQCDNEQEISAITKVLINKAISFSNSNNLPSILDFVLQLNSEKASSKSSDKIHLQSNLNAVHIMTAHSSKGLEFPIVFYLPTLKQLNPRVISQVVSIPGDNSLAFYHTKEIKDPRLSEYKIEKSDRELDEEVRVAYVGLTRARDYLFVSTHHKVTSSKKVVRSNASLIASAIEESRLVSNEVNKVELNKNDFKTDVHENIIHLNEIATKSEVENLRDKIEKERILSPGNKDDQNTDFSRTSPKNILVGPAVGRAVHRVLNIIDFDSDELEIESVSRNCAYHEGIIHEVSKVINYVKKALNTKTIQSLTDNYMKEVPIAGSLKSKRFSGYIDLLIEQEDHFLILDYKTDSITKNIDEKLDLYSKQLATYSLLLKQAGLTKKTKAIFLFLDSKDNVEIEISDLENVEKNLLENL